MKYGTEQKQTVTHKAWDNDSTPDLWLAKMP